MVSVRVKNAAMKLYMETYYNKLTILKENSWGKDLIYINIQIYYVYLYHHYCTVPR